MIRSSIGAVLAAGLLLAPACSEEADVAAVCGNGAVEAGEACDDGNTTSGDDCSADCKAAKACGNALLETGEICDDGNTASGDGCRGDCKGMEQCGDGLLDVGEGCDEGEEASATCSSNCTMPSCGNAVLDAGEECDDGNASETDDCSANCRSLVAGSSCDRPFDLNADGQQADGTWSWSGDTLRFGSHYSSSCGVYEDAEGEQRDGVAHFVAPAAGDYLFSYTADFDAVLYAWTGSCGTSATEAECTHGGMGGSKEFTLTLSQGQSIYLVIDGYIGYVIGGWPAEEGTFTVRASELAIAR